MSRQQSAPRRSHTLWIALATHTSAGSAGSSTTGHNSAEQPKLTRWTRPDGRVHLNGRWRVRPVRPATPRVLRMKLRIRSWLRAGHSSG